MNNLVFGVGIMRSGESQADGPDGKKVTCKIYSRWRDMLKRCYSEEYHANQPTYKDCSVCEDWLTFSNFKAWMEKQDWEGKELDKDILNKSNKIYSPEYCVFVDKSLNLFLTDRSNYRGKYAVGVRFNVKMKKYIATCKNGNGKTVYLGAYSTEIEAANARAKFKHDLACKLADNQPYKRVAEALRVRFKL